MSSSRGSMLVHTNSQTTGSSVGHTCCAFVWEEVRRCDSVMCDGCERIHVSGVWMKTRGSRGGGTTLECACERKCETRCGRRCHNPAHTGSHTRHSGMCVQGTPRQAVQLTQTVASLLAGGCVTHCTSVECVA